MLIVESMDWDNMDRRVSPVALRADGYLDLINGPHDSGTCGGYTCRKRMQTFYTIVAAGLYLISTCHDSYLFLVVRWVRYFYSSSNVTGYISTQSVFVFLFLIYETK